LAASATELYASDSVTNAVKVFRISDMTLQRSFSLAGNENPGRILYNPNDDTVWVAGRDNSEEGQAAQGGSSFPVCQYTPAGTRTANPCITNVTVPTAMVMRGTTILLADAGPDMQIKEFNASGTQISTLGVRGGTISGTSSPGTYANNALSYPVGLGIDDSGNIYVAEQHNPYNYYASAGTYYFSYPEGGDLRSYSPSFALNWKTFAWNLHGQQSAAPDLANDGAEVYGTLARFNMNYGNTTPGGEQTLDAITFDAIHYPDDPRLNYAGRLSAGRILHIGGFTYVYFGGDDAWELGRQSGNLVIPENVWTPKYLPGWANGSKGIGNVQGACSYSNAAGCVWNDAPATPNGEPASNEMTSVPQGAGVDGITKDCQMDDNADLWCTSIYTGVHRWVHSGPSAAGVITYSPASVINYGVPPGFSKPERAVYDSANDRLYVAGWSSSSPDPGNENYGTDVAGNKIARYNAFVATGHYPVAMWTSTLPYTNVMSNGFGVSCPNGLASCPTDMVQTIRMAGNYLFADSYTPEFTIGSYSNGLNLIRPYVFDIWAYNIDTGVQAGNIWPGPETNYYSTNWDDQPWAFTAFRRSSDGQYLIFQQNEINANTLLYRGLLQNFSQY
jgi:hypothetical protein